MRNFIQKLIESLPANHRVYPVTLLASVFLLDAAYPYVSPFLS